MPENEFVNVNSNHYAARMLPQSPESAMLSIDSRHGYAMLLVASGSVAISFGGLIQRNIEFADAWQIILYRAFGTLFAIALILAIQNNGRFIVTIKGIGRFGILAGIFLSVASVCFVQAMVHTTIANALFVLGAIPFFTALLARIFLGERLRRVTLITMLFAAFGLVLMVVKGIGAGSGFGNLMALTTALSFASYAVIVRYRRRVEMLPSLLVSSFIVIVVCATMTGGSWRIPLNDVLLCLFWGSVLSGFVNWTFIIGSRHLAAAEVTLIMLLEFALGPLWVWIFVSETPSQWTLIGGATIIAAVAVRAIVELMEKSKPEQTPRQPL